MLKILLIEDDFHIRTIIKKHLEINAFDVLSASNGQEGFDLYQQHHIDLVITDIMMPITDGQTLIKSIRQHDSHIPIITLTALENFEDKSTSFRNGTDDYLVKPFDLKELVLRVKALLRRSQYTSEYIFSYKSIYMDYKTQVCKINGKDVALSYKEFQLLFLLTTTPDVIFTREQLMNQIWGYDSESYERTVDTHIKRLREKISTHDLEIKTIRGLGYKVSLL